MATLSIRTGIFEHGLFPMQAKFTGGVLINLFTNLNLLSSIGKAISFKV